MATLHDDVSTFMTISRLILLTVRHVLDRSCRENQNGHFMFNNFFQKSCRIWENVEQCGGDRGATNDVTIWRISFACSISKCTRSHKRAHAHAPLQTHACTHTHTYIFNTYCFSAILISQTRVSIALYLHCLSCFVWVCRVFSRE